MYINLSATLACARILMTVLPKLGYSFVITSATATISMLMVLLPLLASVGEESKASIQEVKRSVPLLKDADKRALAYFRRVMYAQRAFGIRVGIFGQVSVDVAQYIVDNSISNAMLAISMTTLSP